MLTEFVCLKLKILFQSFRRNFEISEQKNALQSQREIQNVFESRNVVGVCKLRLRNEFKLPTNQNQHINSELSHNSSRLN